MELTIEFIEGILDTNPSAGNVALNEQYIPEENSLADAKLREDLWRLALDRKVRIHIWRHRSTNATHIQWFPEDVRMSIWR